MPILLILPSISIIGSDVTDPQNPIGNVYENKQYAYNFQLITNNGADSFNDRDQISELFHFNILVDNPCQLYLSTILDTVSNSSVFSKSYYTNDWFNINVESEVLSLVLPYHPEFLFFLKNYYEFFQTKSFIVGLDYTSVENELSPTLQFIDLMFTLTPICALLIIYMSFYNKANTENNMVDSDYLSSSLLVESEKEIASLDDLILAIIIVTYVFGCFFYISSWNIMGSYPELMLVIYLIPFLIYLVFGMPTVLLLDFSNYFLMFIRGCGAYSLFLAELMYDYINAGAFYVRLSVQWVRLFIMFLTFIVMHDTIALCLISNSLFAGMIDYIWESFSNVAVTYGSIAYYSLTSVFITLFRLLFELGHTLFVCTAQFIAFFAISFWFFCFLYTFFTTNKFENYFLLKKNKTA